MTTWCNNHTNPYVIFARTGNLSYQWKLPDQTEAFAEEEQFNVKTEEEWLP